MSRQKNTSLLNEQRIGYFELASLNYLEFEVFESGLNYFTR
jgi:hypothetical protein